MTAGAGWTAALSPERVEALAAEHGTPAYVYSAAILRARCRALVAAFPGARLRYAMKANSNPALLALIHDEGLGIDAVSAYEVRLARELGFRRRAIIWSGNNPSDDELSRLVHARVALNLDAVSAVERLARIAPAGTEFSLRVNCEIGAGHHPHVVTAGPDSKFGVAPGELPAVLAIAKTAGLRLVGLHQHIGSGLFDLEVFLQALAPLGALAAQVPDLEFVDVGGGFGVPYRPDENALDLPAWGRAVLAWRDALAIELGRAIALLVEPGRYVVAEAGALLARVTTLKRTRDRTFVGLDTGMHHLVRPAMYNAFHPVTAVAPREGERERCFFVGPICESGDVLAEEREMVAPREGDLVWIGVAGAYGYAMASQYNVRGRPVEVLVEEDGTARVVRVREGYRDVVRRGDVALARR